MPNASGWGGTRAGAGRKPKDAQSRWLAGNAHTHQTGAKKPQAAVGHVELIPAPDTLSDAEKAVWNALAPHACAQLTLIPATVQAFVQLCRTYVLLEAMRLRLESDGLTYLKAWVDSAGQEHHEVKPHPLLRTYQAQVKAWESATVRFRVGPVGKEMIQPEQPKDEWTEFEKVQ